ncbi:MAG: integrase core domain-containing protein [Rubripirellula sp.]
MKALFTESVRPWECGYIESLNVWLHDEPLNGENFRVMLDAKVLIESSRVSYNTTQPRSDSFGKPMRDEWK